MITDKIKGLLRLSNHKQTELASYMNISKQGLTNKFTNNYMSSDDLIKVAKFCGAELAFLLPNGSKVVLDDSDLKVDKKKPNSKSLKSEKSKVVAPGAPHSLSDILGDDWSQSR